MFLKPRERIFPLAKKASVWWLARVFSSPVPLFRATWPQKILKQSPTCACSTSPYDLQLELYSRKLLILSPCRYSLLDASLAPFPELSVALPVHGTTANDGGCSAYLGLTTIESAVLCVLLKEWQDDSASSVSPLHIRDLELGRHMLRVNGTLARIGSAVEGSRMPSILRPTGRDHGNETPISEEVGALPSFGSSTPGGEQYGSVADSEQFVLKTAPVPWGKKGKKHSRASFTRKSVRRAAEEETAETMPGVVHCMLVDGLQGVVLCSRDGTSLSPIKNARLSKEVRENFHSACGQISGFLHAKRGEVSKTGAFGFPGRALGEVVEHGLMFTVAPEPTAPSARPLIADMSLGEFGDADAMGAAASSQGISYWVVGRLLTDPYGPRGREVYVCFEDGTPTDTVEYAFQIDWH